MRRACSECPDLIPIGRRSDAAYCSSACRVRAHRRRTADAIPQEMRTADRWMRYRLVPRGGRVTKVPTRINGRQASSTDARTWSTYAEAKASTVGNGLGFALGENVGCIDLDHAIVDGVVEPWAQAILDAAPGTYVEVSQSEEGIHIFGRLAEGPGRNLRSSGRTVEVYSAGRYIAVTGRRFGDAPSRLADLGGLVSSLL
ncbi:DNA primase [Brachybacterium alimentarium]|nr:DNA primase [Brachybacterium alimentarium]